MHENNDICAIIEQLGDSLPDQCKVGGEVLEAWLRADRGRWNDAGGNILRFQGLGERGVETWWLTGSWDDDDGWDVHCDCLKGDGDC